MAHRSPSRRWYPDVWDLPGSHVDRGETEREALHRELHEELGIGATEIVPEPIARISERAAGLELSLWVVRGWIGTPTNTQPHEHDVTKWVGPDELPRLHLAHADYLRYLTALLTH